MSMMCLFHWLLAFWRWAYIPMGWLIGNRLRINRYILKDGSVDVELDQYQRKLLVPVRFPQGAATSGLYA